MLGHVLFCYTAPWAHEWWGATMEVGAEQNAASNRKIREDWRLLRRGLSYVWPHGRTLALFLTLVVGNSLVGLGPPLVIRLLIDRALPTRNAQLMSMYVAVLVALLTTNALLSWFAAVVGSRTTGAIVQDLRLQLYRRLQEMPLSFFVHTRGGALTTRLVTDVRNAQQLLTRVLTTVVVNAITLLTSLLAIAALDWHVAVLTLALVPIFFAGARALAGRQRRVVQAQLTAMSAMTAHATERLSPGGRLVASMFGSAQEEQRLFGVLSDDVRRLTAAIGSLMGLRSSVLTFLGGLAIAGVLWVGGGAVMAGAVSIGTVVALIQYMQRAMAPSIGFANLSGDIMTGFVSLRRVFEVLDFQEVTPKTGLVRDLQHVDGSVTLTDVSFRYPTAAESAPVSLRVAPSPGSEAADGPASEHNRWALTDVNVRFDTGSRTIVTGPSGAGKSSLLNLITGLYEPTRGRIVLAGVDTREISQAMIARVVGFVTQQTYLFHATIAENLRYAAPGSTRADLERACQLAGLSSLIERLPLGLDTLVGESGVRLSGGEKQRVAIARVILHDPAILILDEPTAHLDAEAEAEVLVSLRSVTEGRTIIAVGHRLLGALDADRVIVVRDGRIMAEMSPTEAECAVWLVPPAHEKVGGKSAIAAPVQAPRDPSALMRDGAANA